MNFFVCSTPYHIFISLCIIYDKKGENNVFYLTTHDELSEVIFYNVENKLREFSFVDEVIIRKRSRINEKLYIEKAKDHFFNTKAKGLLKGRMLYGFSWNPYSLYSPFNYLYKKAKKVVLIEEGANLYSYLKPSNLKLLTKKYLYGIKTNFYKDNKLEKILVQFPEKYPSHLQYNLEKLDMNLLYKNINPEHKRKIVSLFLNGNEKDKLINIDTTNAVIVLTQPLSEDGYMTEEKKKALYKEIVDNYKSHYNVILKKHPREKTVYNFENVLELEGYFPSEIFVFINLKFQKAIGVCTSAIFQVDAEEKINIDENFFNKESK